MLAHPRSEQHELYGADIAMVELVAQINPRILYLEWFQKKRWTNRSKGIVRINLEADDDWYTA
jgi:hypothetical protein